MTPRQAFFAGISDRLHEGRDFLDHDIPDDTDASRAYGLGWLYSSFYCAVKDREVPRSAFSHFPFIFRRYAKKPEVILRFLNSFAHGLRGHRGYVDHSRPFWLSPKPNRGRNYFHPNNDDYTVAETIGWLDGRTLGTHLVTIKGLLPEESLLTQLWTVLG